MPARIEIDSKKVFAAFRDDRRFIRYMRQIALGLIDAMLYEFNLVQNPDNEHLLSPTTLPKYVASFSYEIEIDKAKVHVYNDDPAWNMVEWGAHAFGRTWVLGYKPMTRGLELYANGVAHTKRNLTDPGFPGQRVFRP